MIPRAYRNAIEWGRRARREGYVVDGRPTISSGYNSYWVAQYIDGNKVAPYRLVKDGKTVGYTNRDNLQAVK